MDILQQELALKLWAVGLISLLSFSIYFSSILALITIVGAIQWNRIYKRQKKLHIEKQTVTEYCSINEQLQEHAKIASPEILSLCSFYKTIVKNEKLKEHFTLLDNVDVSTEEEAQKTNC